MKNRIKIFAIIGTFFAASCFIGINVFANTNTSTILADWGKYLNANYHDAGMNIDVYAEGERTCITNNDIEQVQKFYMLFGMDEQIARETAVEYVKEREALYQEAIDNGYSVTDEEVWDYIEELKEIINSADNKEDALAIMNQFDSEEDYWNYEFSVYQKNLPIQNYVHDIEQMFMQRSTYADKGPNDIELEWQQYFEQMKADLVDKENYQMISN